MEVDFFLVTFIILFLIITVFHPMAGYYDLGKLKKAVSEGGGGQTQKNQVLPLPHTMVLGPHTTYFYHVTRIRRKY